jgi:hypothetical protein
MIQQSSGRSVSWKWLHFFTEMLGPTTPSHATARHARKSGLSPPRFRPLVTGPNLWLHYKSNNIARVKENRHDVRLHIRANKNNLDMCRLTRVYHLNLITYYFFMVRCCSTRCWTPTPSSLLSIHCYRVVRHERKRTIDRTECEWKNNTSTERELTEPRV